MSGPGLKKADSHAAIHEAALNEARELTDMVRTLLNQGDKEKALEVAYVTLEHWESRTLAHADAEEAGLYQELAGDHPESCQPMIRLTRDHDLLRQLAKEIKDSLAKEEVGIEMLHRFYAMIEVDRLHNQDEEQWVAEQAGVNNA